MTSRRKKRRKSFTYQDAELNLMPFIDVFSVLNVFLLTSVAFVAIGVIKVQVPFFTNVEDNSKPKRSLELKVDLRKDQIFLETNYTLPPVNATKDAFSSNDAGVKALHEKLVQLKQANLEEELVQFFIDDDVIYERVILVLDAIKNRNESDPVFVSKESDGIEAKNINFVFPKVVMSSVIL